MGYDIRMYKKDSIFISKKKPETLDLAIVFITTEGIQHSVGGVAKYIRHFILTLVNMQKSLEEFGVEITLYAAEPGLLRLLPSYNTKDFKSIREVVESTGGKVFKLVNNTYGEDWISHEENWKILSSSAATIALNVSEDHQATIVFFGSSCLSLSQVYIHKQIKAFTGDIQTVYLTHDSAFSKFHKERYENILSMDFLCSQWTKFTPNAKIGYVSKYMKKVFEENYFVNESAFVPCKSGILLEDSRYSELSKNEITQILIKNNIPLDKKNVFTWGRADGYKRLDLIHSAGKLLGEEYVPISVTNSKYPELNNYIKNINGTGILIENYKEFELINALISWENTVAICLFSENEPGAMTPMEAMYLCNRGTGIVLTNKQGVYPELIADGENGFMVDNNVEEIANKIKYISEIAPEQRITIQQNACETIENNFSQKSHYIETLQELIPMLKDFKN